MKTFASTVLAASSGWGFVIAGYVATLGGLAAYVARTLLRGRALSKQVSPEDRRWM
jgi:hypothetical protein